MSSELVYVKLGGSVITDKRRAETARPDVIRRLAQELREAREAAPGLQLLLGHGGGSFPHVPAHEYRVHEGISRPDSWRGYCLTQAAAARLNRLVADLFLEEGLPVATIAPSSSALCEAGRLVELAVEPLRRLLDAGQVPLVYGDAVLDRVQGCAIASTEDLFGYLSGYLPPQRLILVGEVRGIYTADPNADPAAQLIGEMTGADFARVASGLGGSHGTDVTGGMLGKVRSMLDLLAALPSLRIQFISGDDPGALAGAMLRQVVQGTVLTA